VRINLTLKFCKICTVCFISSCVSRSDEDFNSKIFLSRECFVLNNAPKYFENETLEKNVSDNNCAIARKT